MISQTPTWGVLFICLFTLLNLYYLYRSHEVISIDNQLPLLGTVAMSENQQIRTISLVTSIKSLVQHEKEDKQQTSFQNLNDKKISPTSKSNEVIKIKEKPLKLKLKNHGNVWPQQLIAKLQCLHSGGLEGVFLYHMRKAAGTTIRNILTDASSRWQMPFFETEGPTLNSLFLNENFLTVTSLRDPIERIQSLYWYEHVGWFHGVKKETEKCKSFKVWVDAWRDGSKWKTEFITENPSSVYVEIENYYVKALSGWIGPDPISEKDYLIAIDNLNKFDIIYVTEWMNLEGQVKAMNSVFSMQATVMKHSAGNFRRLVERVGDEKLDSGHEVKGDKSVREELGPVLASDQAAVLDVLKSINKYDIQLWKYSQIMLADRLLEIDYILSESSKPMKINQDIELSTKNSYENSNTNYMKIFNCKNVNSGVIPKLNPLLAGSVGIFQPPGHKGPL